MKYKIVVIQFLVVLVLGSCGRQHVEFPQAKVKDPAKVHINIHRYGKQLFGLDTARFKAELKSIQDEFTVFLGDDLDNEANIQQLLDYVTDTQIIRVYHKTMEVFPDLKELEKQLSDAFGRYISLFPGKQVPGIYTYVSDVYYEVPVMKRDTVLIIALDDFLGPEFPVYRALGIPLYKIRCMQPEFIPVEVMKVMYYDDLAAHYQMKTLLDRMIYEGKIMAYLDAVLPNVPDSVKICYTAHQMDWAQEHEKDVWGFLVENKLLYSTDYQMISKLMQDGPFTNGFGNQSPSRLGIYMGWQIVREFLRKNPGISLSQMIGITDAQMILEKSRYKPR